MKMRSLALRASLLFVALSLASYLTHARFPQPKEEYQARREKLRAQVDGPVVLFGYTSRQEGGEVAVFFQDENFYYLSGYDEPDAALLLIPDSPTGKKLEGPSEILYLPPRDPRRAKWEGPKLGPDDPNAAERAGFQAVKPYANLRGDLVSLSKSYPNFYTPLPSRPENGYPHLATSSAWVREALPGANVQDVTAALTAMRMVKSAGELALLQKAIDVSVDAHLAAMKMMRPGLYEYQVAARWNRSRRRRWERRPRVNTRPIRGFPSCARPPDIHRGRGASSSLQRGARQRRHQWPFGAAPTRPQISPCA